MCACLYAHVYVHTHTPRACPETCGHRGVHSLICTCGEHREMLSVFLYLAPPIPLGERSLTELFQLGWLASECWGSSCLQPPIRAGGSGTDCYTQPLPSCWRSKLGASPLHNSTSLCGYLPSPFFKKLSLTLLFFSLLKNK